MDFVPTRVGRLGDGVFIIYGRFRDQRREVVTESEGSIEAHWERGDWYFSRMAEEVD